MTEIRKMFKQSTHYLYGNVLVMIAHMISFPILTRLLSVSDYGILGLLTVTIYLVIAFCKSGIQNSFIRFYDEYKYTKEKKDIYFSTFFFGPIGISFLVTLTFSLLFSVFLRSYINKQLITLLPFVSIIILSKAIYFLFMSFWRAEQRTKLYNNYLIFVTFLNIFLGIVFLLFFQRNIYSFIIGQLFGELIAFCIVIFMIYKDYGANIKIKNFSIPLFKEALFFGLPLLGMEFTNFMLSAGDRYTIAALMNNEALGLYAAAGNLASSVSGCLVSPISFAITPIFMNSWFTKGKEATQEFLSKVTSCFFMLAFPIILGMIATGKDIIRLFASSKYVASYKVIPFLITGMILFGLTNIVNSGLLVKKKTLSLMMLTMGSGVLNITLNIIFIKMGMGIVGAAFATFISYLFLVISTIIVSFKYLSFKINLVEISQYLLFSLVMYLFISQMNFNNYLFSLFAKFFSGMIIYGILILIFKKEITSKFIHFLNELKLMKGD